MSNDLLTEAMINQEAAIVWKRLTQLDWDDKLWLDWAREQIVSKYATCRLRTEYLLLSLDNFSRQFIVPLLEQSAKARGIQIYTLRHLADAMRKAVEDHPAYGQGASVIVNCCDHLCALAAVHEANQRTSDVQAELDQIRKLLPLVPP